MDHNTLNSDFYYDVAISFAEEDNLIALCIYLALKIERPNSLNMTFYYKQNLDHIGQKLTESLPLIYGHKSRFVIMVVSKNYVKKKKKYVQIEKEAIIERWSGNQDATFMIPLLIDDTVLSEVNNGFTNDVAYLHWNNEPELLAKRIWEMLGKPVEQAKIISKKEYVMNAKVINIIEKNEDGISFNFTSQP